MQRCECLERRGLTPNFMKLLYRKVSACFWYKDRCEHRYIHHVIPSTVLLGHISSANNIVLTIVIHYIHDEIIRVELHRGNKIFFTLINGKYRMNDWIQQFIYMVSKALDPFGDFRLRLVGD